MAWTDDKTDAVVADYLAIMESEYKTDVERAAATVEVVSGLARDYGETPNSVRMVLSKAGVYIKAAKGRKETTASDPAKRINKAESQKALSSLIESIGGVTVDEDILSRLTGKAAAYLTEVVVAAMSSTKDPD